MNSSAPVLKFNLPTILTLSRVVLIPVFILTAPDRPVLGAAIFIAASVTDFLDGYLARRMGAVTKFGILFDPIADKFLVISALVLLVNMARLSVWIVSVLILREFLVTALRAVALAKGIIIAAEMGGKLKTAAQFMGIVILVLGRKLPALDLFGLDFYDFGLMFILIALVLGVVSGVKYTVSFWRAI